MNSFYSRQIPAAGLNANGQNKPVPLPQAPIAARTCPICPSHGRGSCDPMRVEEILRAIKASRVMRVIPAGDSLYQQGMPSPSYFVVLEGWIALSAMLEDGERQILDFVLPGELLGVQPYADASFGHSAETLTKTKVLVLPRAEFDAAMAADPGLMKQIMRIAACREARAFDQMQNIGRRSARNRIAHLFTGLFYQLKGHFPSEPGETVELQLTLNHIGDALGLTNVHVSRTLGELRKQGLLQLNQRRMTVLDPKALMQASGYAQTGSNPALSPLRIVA